MGKRKIFVQGAHPKQYQGLQFGAETWVIPEPTSANLEVISLDKFPGETVVLYFAPSVNRPTFNGLTYLMRWSLVDLAHHPTVAGHLSITEVQHYEPTLPHYMVLNQARNCGSNQWKLKRVFFSKTEKARYIGAPLKY